MLSTVCLISYLLITPLTSIDCPNREFHKVANWGQVFELNPQQSKDHFDRYYVAFGTTGQWVISLVDVNTMTHVEVSGALSHIALTDNLQTFKCKGKYWHSVDVIKPEVQDQYICCVREHSVDTAKSAFAVLPDSMYAEFKKGEQIVKHRRVYKETRKVAVLEHTRQAKLENVERFYWVPRWTWSAASVAKTAGTYLMASSIFLPAVPAALPAIAMGKKDLIMFQR